MPRSLVARSDRTARRLQRLFCALALAASLPVGGSLALADGASAANVTGGSTLLYIASFGETNHVSITKGPGTYIFSESGAGVTLTGSSGCVAAANVVTCPEAGVTHMAVLTFDLDDGVDVAPSISIPATIAAGDGEDSVVAGAGDDSINGGLGDDSIDGGAGSNAVSYSGSSSGVQVNLSLLGPQ